MSSRLKERGGASGKVVAAKPHLAPAEKPLLKAPPSGKENQRSISAGRPSVNRHHPTESTEKPAAGLRRSTSSIPKSRDPLLLPSSLRSSSNLKSARLKAMERCPMVQSGSLKGYSAVTCSGPVASEVSSRKGSSFVGIPRREGEKRSTSVGRSAKIGRNSIGSVPLVQPIARHVADSSGGDRVVFDSKTRKQTPFEAANNFQTGKKEPAPGGSTLRDGMRKSEGGCRNTSNPMVIECQKNLHGLVVSKNGTGYSAALELEKASDKTGVMINMTALESRKSVVADGVVVFEDGNKMTGDKKEDRGLEKYPSKLREKLALLEGKVQRIAMDIKKTKEMLDSNSTHASKVMLTDIQRQITGIEKAVGHVISKSQGETGLDDSTKERDQNVDHMDINKLKEPRESGIKNDSSKVLEEEVLEARFFPHQKLLVRNKVPEIQSDQNESSKTSVKEHGLNLLTREGLGNIDEDPIAVEFLESLNNGPSKNILKTNAIQLGSVLKEMASADSSSLDGQCVQKGFLSAHHDTTALIAQEKLDDFENQENKPVMMLREGSDESFGERLFEIGHKTSTGGWFVSEGEAVLLANSDGSCTYFDIANNEEKSQYEPPPGLSNNMWGDCWLIRAPGVDGCSGKYVVAASAGNTLDSGFCSWDFYKKDIQAFRLEAPNSFPASASSSSRTVLAPLPNRDGRRRTCTFVSPSEVQHWWYRPCGYLILSTSSKQNVVSAYDVRDGALSMTWATQNPVAAMEYSCPLQWRSRGKVVIAGTESICLWDVNSLNPQPVRSVACDDKKVLALHVNNTDAELGGGVRQRVSSSEAEGHDGVFCTSDSIVVLDHRNPTGIGLKIQSSAANTPLSVFSRGDSILVGCSASSSTSIQGFSIRKAKLAATYPVPGSAGAHFHHSYLAQVWGNSNLVMGISGMGLSVFDEGMTKPWSGGVALKEMVGPDDLYLPSFDYMAGRVLLISRDRPAMCRYLASL